VGDAGGLSQAGESLLPAQQVIHAQFFYKEDE
jgi:hypothetical protein